MTCQIRRRFRDASVSPPQAPAVVGGVERAGARLEDCERKGRDVIVALPAHGAVRHQRDGQVVLRIGSLGRAGRAARGACARNGDDYALPSWDVGSADILSSTVRSMGGGWRHDCLLGRGFTNGS